MGLVHNLMEVQTSIGTKSWHNTNHLGAEFSKFYFDRKHVRLEELKSELSLLQWESLLSGKI